MAGINGVSSKWEARVLFLSLLLLFFTVPHTLEDFATGEPAEAGLPAPLIALVVSTIFALQALGLFWIGQNKKRGVYVQIGIALFWPIAAGFAQLPTIFSGTPYRSGFISVFYVFGLIVVALLLLITAIISLRAGSKTS